MSHSRVKIRPALKALFLTHLVKVVAGTAVHAAAETGTRGDHAARAARCAAATHSAAIEAGRASPRLTADLDLYRAGSIDLDELLRRTTGRLHPTA